MIGLPRGVEVFRFDQPCDMRRSFNTLSLLVEQSMGRNLLQGDLYVFVSSNRSRCKVLYFDGAGLCLFAKRMEAGRRLKSSQLTLSELALFVEGATAARQKLSPAVILRADLTRPKAETETLVE